MNADRSEEPVTATLSGDGLAVELHAEGHRLQADEPAHLGGTETGPSPYGYLLSALGACTAMTLRMYASRKGWPLERVEVKLQHNRVHARDCAECENKTGMIDVIDREIAVEGALDGVQRARLLEMANRCPVHRTLQNEIRIRTTLDDQVG